MRPLGHIGRSVFRNVASSIQKRVHTSVPKTGVERKHYTTKQLINLQPTLYGFDCNKQVLPMFPDPLVDCHLFFRTAYNKQFQGKLHFPMVSLQHYLEDRERLDNAYFGSNCIDESKRLSGIRLDYQRLGARISYIVCNYTDMLLSMMIPYIISREIQKGDLSYEKTLCLDILNVIHNREYRTPLLIDMGGIPDYCVGFSYPNNRVYPGLAVLYHLTPYGICGKIKARSDHITVLDVHFRKLPAIVPYPISAILRALLSSQIDPLMNLSFYHSDHFIEYSALKHARAELNHASLPPSSAC